MPRSLAVKVCGMREPANVRDVCALGPNYMGFIFVRRSPRYVGEDPNELLFTQIPKSVKSVAVFADEDVEQVAMISKRFGFRAIQLHGSEDGAYRTKLKALRPNIEIIQAVSMSRCENLDSLDETGVDLFVFDNGSGGSGTKFDWSRLNDYHLSTPFLVAGGIGLEEAQQLRECIDERLPMVGIDVNSAVEVSPGLKDVTRIEALLKVVRG